MVGVRGTLWRVPGFTAFCSLIGATVSQSVPMGIRFPYRRWPLQKWAP